MSDLIMTLSDLDRVRITKDTGQAVYFTVSDTKRYLIKQDNGNKEWEDDWFSLYEMNGDRPEFIVSVSGTMPRLTYPSGCKVYKQARTRPWLLALAQRQIILLATEDSKLMSFTYAKEHLSLDELAIYMGVHLASPTPCPDCLRKSCPFRKFNVKSCARRRSTPKEEA